MKPKDLGQLAETEAVHYLSRLGYRIVERNLRNQLGEIDIVAEKDETLVFVEVKAGRRDDDFAPREHLDWKKVKKLKSLAQAYLDSLPGEKAARIDLIEIIEHDGKFKIDHFEGVNED